MRTSDELLAHVMSLARAFKVRVQFDPSMPVEDAGAGIMTNRATGERFLDRKVVFVREVTSHASYAVALHELGHCVHPNGQLMLTECSPQFRATGRLATLRDVRLKIDEELAAWAWAKANALEWTLEMEQTKRISFASYRKLGRLVGIHVPDEA